MSQASSSVTLTRIKNGMSYGAMFVISKGDLWQDYNAQKIAPDFTVAANQPEVKFVCTTSEGSVPDTIEIYWDDVRVTFASLTAGSLNTASAGLAAGTIKIVQGGPQSNNTRLPWILRFVKNIAVPTAGTLASHVLKIVGVFASGKAEHARSFEMRPLTDSGESVHIQPSQSDPSPFVVDQNKANSSTTLVAQIYQGGKPLSTPGSDFTYQWYKQDSSQSSGWQTLAGKTSSSLTVTKDDVDTYAQYRVVVSHNGNTFSDTQSVMDIGDPYEVGIGVYSDSGCTSSASPNMNGDVSSTEKRVFKASLVSRNGGAVPTILNCCWMITGVDGVLLNTWSSNTNSHGIAKSTYSTLTLSVPAAWLDEIGAQSVDITAQVSF